MGRVSHLCVGIAGIPLKLVHAGVKHFLLSQAIQTIQQKQKERGSKQQRTAIEAVMKGEELSVKVEGMKVRRCRYRKAR